MSTATTEVGAAAATPAMTAVATRVAAICDLITDHHDAGTTISARRAAAILTMIEAVAATATAAEDRPRTTRRRKRRMGSARWYQEVSRLGGGGFGVVVRARHRATGQDVAVKSLLPRRGADVGDLLREAAFMAACQGHPSHVTLRGVVREPGTTDYSLVMDYVGPSLQDVLQERRRRPFPEADVRRILRQLLAGAEAMHGHGIVHRDIKPAHILVDDGDGGGAAKICGFGMAKSTAEEDPPYCIAGTLAYMAPEVLVKNYDHDTAVDAWSLGCVMAELLTGKLPFAGKNETDQLYKIFDVVGVPGKRAWQGLKPLVLADEVQQWRARQRRVGYRNRLRELFPEEMLSKDGFEVLRGLLTCDPTKRLTAAAALRCPWFADDIDDARDVPAAATAVSKVCGATATTAWSLVLSCVGRALGFLRPKVL